VPGINGYSEIRTAAYFVGVIKKRINTFVEVGADICDLIPTC